MNIGFDAKRFYFNNTGLGNYSRNLIFSLLKNKQNHNYFLYSPKKAELEARFMGFSNLFPVFPQKKSLLWRQFGIAKEIEKQNLAIFHGLSHEIPFGLKKSKTKTIVSIHDLIFEVYPQLFKPIDRFLYQKKYKSSCLRADKIIAVSESTKQDLINYYPIDENKISVVYQTCNQAFQNPLSIEKLNITKKKFNLPQNYILYVGSIIKRKNLLDLVKALKITPKADRIPIVAIGNGGEYLQEIKSYIAENHLENEFIHIQNISNEELIGFYQMADLFVYTSSYEGFGIPVIEALNSHVPVITSNVSSLPEAGGDAACYVTPGNIDELQAAILKTLNDKELQKQMIEKGIVHAQKFSYQRMAEETMNVYEELVS